MYHRILVPVDGSATSRRGLEEAARLAKSLQAQLRLLHVVDESALTLNPEVTTATTPLIDEFVAGGKEVLRSGLELAQGLGVTAETVLYENLSGRVADLILQEAKKWGADLVVMGTHGRRGLRHAVLGSDAEAVVRSSTVPVLLVRAPERAA